MVSKEKQSRIQNIMLTVAMLILLVTAVLPLFNVHWEYTKYIFAFGAVLALAGLGSMAVFFIRGR